MALKVTSPEAGAINVKVDVACVESCVLHFVPLAEPPADKVPAETEIALAKLDGLVTLIVYEVEGVYSVAP